MNEQLIREIVDPVARKQVADLTGDLEKNYKVLQDTILGYARLNDVIGQSKGFKDFEKNALNLAKTQEDLARKTAQTQLAEEKLAAFRSAQLAKEQAIIDKKIANENKLAEAAIRRAKIVKESTASDLSNSTSTGGTNTGTTVNANNLSDAAAANAATQAYNQNTKSVQQNTLSKKQLALIEAQEKEALRQNALALKLQAKELNAAKGSLDQRAAALTRLQKQLSSLNEQERSSAFGQRLTRTVGQLNAQVLELEKGALGKSGRNVGNYPLFNSIQQGATKAFSAVRTLANILPGVGLAGLLGFAVEPIIEYITQLDVFKKKAVDVVKETAATSSEFTKSISDVTKLKTSIEEFQSGLISKTELVNRFNSSIGESVGKLKTAAEVEDFYNKSAGAYVKATFLRAQANAALQAATDKSSESLKALVSGPSFTDYLKTGVQSIAQIFAGGGLQSIDRLMNSATTNQLTGAAKLKDESEELIKLFDVLQKNADKFAKDNGFDFTTKNTLAKTKTIDLARRNAAALIQIEIDANKEAAQYYQQGLENQNFGLEGRLESLKNFSDTSVEIIRLEGEKEKAAKKLTANQVLAVDADTALKTQKIREDSSNKVYEITKQSLARTNSAIAEQSAKNLAAIETERDQVLSALEESYANGFISLQNYNFRKAEIEKQYTLQYIGLQIEQTKVAIEQAKLRGENTDDAERKLSETELKYQQLRVANNKTATDKQIEKAKERFELEKQIAQELFNLTTTLFKRGSELRLNALQEESDTIDKQRDKDINAAEKTVINETEKNKRIKEINSDATLSETERKNKIAQLNKEIEESEATKADRIAIINAKADSQQQLIEQRVRQEKIKQAKADKAAAIAQAIINGALAMTKVAAQTGVLTFAFSPLIAALTAVQVAAIVAQPIPKYKDGKSKSNNYSGAAWVGDGGMSELVIEPNGSMWVTPDKPTLTHVGKDTQVISGPEFKRMLAKPTSYGGQSGSGIDLTPLITEQKKGNRSLEKAFKSQKSYNTVMTEKGFRSGQMKSSKTNEYFNRNFR